MKRKIALVLTCLMVAGTAAGCGKDTGTTNDPNTSRNVKVKIQGIKMGEEIQVQILQRV